jgi:hypothetical protein
VFINILSSIFYFCGVALMVLALIKFLKQGSERQAEVDRAVYILRGRARTKDSKETSPYWKEKLVQPSIDKTVGRLCFIIAFSMNLLIGYLKSGASLLR